MIILNWLRWVYLYANDTLVISIPYLATRGTVLRGAVLTGDRDTHKHNAEVLLFYGLVVADSLVT